MVNKELMGVILSRDNLLRAYKRVVQNGGAAGVVSEERLKQRGYISFKDYYHQVRQKSVVS